MLPGTNFATPNVHTKKASLDAFSVSSSQFYLKWRSSNLFYCVC